MLCNSIRIDTKAILIIYLLFATACNDKVEDDREFTNPEQIQLFRELTAAQTGFQFENALIENNRINILNYLYYYNGSGVGIGDLNNDGLPDIYMASSVGKNKLFLNKGDLNFEDITQQANVDGGFGITTGVNLVDINNDGLLDIYVCKSGADSKTYRTNLLFINQGNLKFKEQAAAYGLADHSFSNQAYFFDMDLDGDLDMYLVNHPVDWPNMNKIMTGEQEFEGFSYQFSDKLYENIGNQKFKDITVAAGVQNRNWGLSATIGDFNGDNYPDIYVANDFIKPDNLYINNGDGTFTDEIQSYFRHISFYSMGSDFADINNDGYNDLFVADMAMSGHSRSKTNMGSMSTENFQTIVRRGYHYPYSSNTLQLNLGNNKYVDIAQLSNVAKTDWSWSPLLVDVDNDGFKDIFVTNGIYRDIIDNDFLLVKATYDQQKERNYFDDLIHKIPQTKVRNVVFKNNGDISFKNMSEKWGISKITNSNGAAYADLDLDGDLDFITNNLNEPSFIYENLAADSLNHRFLKIKLIGSKYNVDAIGTKVELAYGNQVQRLDLQPARGYLSSSDRMIHFGLGNYSGQVDITVTWPDGKISTMIAGSSTNQNIVFDYTKANGQTDKKLSNSAQLFSDETENFELDYTHKESSYNDFHKELLLPHKLSQNGPFISVADVNGDGLVDFFIGGSAGEPGKLFTQTSQGHFESCAVSPWLNDKGFEDQQSIFFDADGDDDMDLYVVSGSNEFDNKNLYQDRLYLNDGNGNYTLSKQSLPQIHSSGMAVDAGDFDNDGDVDLVVGGRVVPGKYPSMPRTYLLENSGGKFVDVTEEKAVALKHLGMITDIQFTDYDNDNDLDMIAVGEWLPITILENSDSNFKIKPVESFKETSGWWFSIASGDIDNDGDIDFALGNLGLNNKYHPSPDHPLHIYYNDFDKNGIGDIILSKTEKGVDYPVRGKECSSQQMPIINANFPTYKSFADASLQSLLGDESLNEALHHSVQTFESCLLINKGDGEFDIKSLPKMSQLSPLMSIKLDDLDQDGHLDLIGVGNFHATETETIRYDAGSGIYLKGNGNGEFFPLLVNDTGLYVDQDAKDLQFIKLQDDQKGILISATNDKLKLLKVIDEL